MREIKVYVPGIREKFELWIKTRGGVKVWRNIDLSNCGAGPIFTPALTDGEDGKGIVSYPKPSWRVDNGEVVTDISRFKFAKGFKEFKRIRVALRRGNGLNFCLTDGSQRKVDQAVEAAEEKFGEATFRKDGGLFDDERFIVVEVPEWEDQ